MIKTYAELKRELALGKELKLIYSSVPNHKYLNTTRKIAKVQTNGIKFEGGSWLGLGMYGEKAQDFSFQEKGFTVKHPNGLPLLKYQFVN